MNSSMWMDDIRAFAERFRVYAVDMIGEPGLSAPSRPPLSSDVYAVWLDDVLRRLSMPVPAIVGGKDVLLDSAGTKRRLERFAPDAEVAYLPEAGHVIPGQTARLLAFLNPKATGLMESPARRTSS